MFRNISKTFKLSKGFSSLLFKVWESRERILADSAGPLPFRTGWHNLRPSNKSVQTDKIGCNLAICHSYWVTTLGKIKMAQNQSGHFYSPSSTTDTEIYALLCSHRSQNAKLVFWWSEGSLHTPLRVELSTSIKDPISRPFQVQCHGPVSKDNSALTQSHNPTDHKSN